MQYPLISEYLAAIREAKDNLDKLSHLVPVLDKYGEPYRSSGAFAVVFKMKDEQTGKCYALKCFTEEQEGRAEAYRQIAEEFEFVDSPYITSVKYLEKEMFVDSNCENEEFPVLLMDWIEGETMETYVAANYTDTHAMSMLCYRFCKMAAWLRSQSFAHGDIKPDNIMVRPDGTLTLVDYDSMFVPAMKGQKSPTIGTKDFSHPLRTIDDFNETIDDFALASIALSLKAISLDPSLLQTYGASDRLLFSAADYLDLSKSNTFAAMQDLLADEEAITLMSMFLLAKAKKNLSMCSFRLFDIQKPKEEEVWSTEVTKEDLKNAVEDEFGVKYSKDWKRLLKAPAGLEGEYSIREGVKVVGNDAFQGCGFLTNIDLPDSLTSIGRNAFWGCDSLTSINIPNSVTIIGNGAFGGCRFLTSINIPNSVTTIGICAFISCSFLTNINIPNSVTTIGNSAFMKCESLTYITIPSSVVDMIGNPFCRWHGILNNKSKAFIYEDNVLFNKDKTTLIAYRAKKTNYIIPNGTTRIGDSAFCGCESLTSIKIPNSVTSIGICSFLLCYSLTRINIPNSVTTIKKGAFWCCNSLTSINIPDSVTTIEKGAFRCCESLVNINIPNSITSIGDYAFEECNNLKSITIPNSVTSIGGSAFSGCSCLTSINIPNSVTCIEKGTFRCCGSLVNINIPNSITSIGDYAFEKCNNLKSIIIPNSVTSIGNSAFGDCSCLTSINIPNSVTCIEKGAFRCCGSLVNIIIPNSVTTIESGAFGGCNNIPSQIKSDIIQRFGEKVFE